MIWPLSWWANPLVLPHPNNPNLWLCRAAPARIGGMTLHAPNIRPIIRPLDEAAINRIAAGEVVERPASAVKELVENALDAGARRIAVDYSAGGKLLIRVTDDGCGMTPDDLPLAVASHATSKIDGSDLLNIRSFGFRGEALASLGSVGRLTLTSRAEGHDGSSLTVAGGRMGPVRPAAATRGTVIELRDLFYATPARLKFLRSDRAESQAIAEVVRRLAMAEPQVGFTLSEVTEGEAPRVIFRADPLSGDFFESLHGRLAGVLGADFIENALKIDVERDGLRLTGYAALPTYSRGSSVQQFVFVNGRPVLDRMLLGALRVAYFDFLSRDRHPAAVLNLICDPERVDVNVHPAKSEVRFREPEAARSLIITGLRTALSGAGHRASTTVADATLAALRPEPVTQPSFPRIYQMERPSQSSLTRSFAYQAPEAPQGFAEAPTARVETPFTPDASRLLEISDDLTALGLTIEPFGGNAIAVRETPAILGNVSAAALLRDVLDELADLGQSQSLRAKMDAIMSRMACHGSIRSGRQMRAEEMNALLREMEATPHSGQCNHGRPTYVELKLADIERLFGRR